MEFAVCMIISKSHISYLRTMLQSLRQFHSQVPAYVLFLDSYDGFIDPHTEGIEAFTMQQVGVKDWEQLELLGRLSVFELACLMKAKFMKFLLQRKKPEKLFYLDTDLYFYSGMTGAARQLDNNFLFLTPHLLKADFKADAQKMADEAVIVGNGLYNMGFFGIRKSDEACAFLDWWLERKLFYCKRDIQRGFFDDQKWMDPVPIYFKGVHVSKDPGLNVANWNLHERPIQVKNGSYQVNGAPLVFFHFSRFRPDQSYRLSQYRLIEMGDYRHLDALCDNYKQRLVANEWRETIHHPFSLIREIEGSAFRKGAVK